MVKSKSDAALALSTCRAIEWLKSGKTYALNTNLEKTRLEWSPHGTWSMETLPMVRQRPFQPRVFFREMHQWNRFLKEYDIDSFQLHHAQTHETRTCGRVRESRSEWLWRVSLHLPTQYHSTLVINLEYVSKAPPGRKIRQDLAQIAHLGPMEMTADLPSSLFLEGRFFLQAVAPALNHLVETSSPLGTWIRGRRDLPPFLARRPGTTTNGDAGHDRTQPLAFSWIDEIRFHPTQLEPKALSNWEVFFYDGSTTTFFCRKIDAPHVWVGWQPTQPVHRYFKYLTFVNRVQTWVIDQTRITFPDVILTNSSPSKISSD